ncbi:vacuolar protein 14 C-terminal Fig4p binding-domain-containing protein [Kockovaella imperatae]|uniref:Vacuolar protein 14 C-terminal Fig4p binding-domain-containing protein n=1 Tax=Kockovaella imperatae TaxID=4999 RepID=A0A1Y1UIH7_9TREE|nr:vacuolar protein 14 C-terminal Fig4p binding-domain-containing protein [Kockovaella imperatae]ORX37306.1 vacuolar protein 14 C-terminal Fig4p binding-domain-containing protein [Kockovaella imperatae]
MEPNILRGLNDKLYDRRKAAAVELETLVLASDMTKISTIVGQLCGMFTSTSAALHSRNGGLIGLAATAIALGQDFAPFLEKIIPPILTCFQDPESRLRYHACESLYNIAKVSKGEILVYFNEIFDALSKLSSDSEASVKNGAELLDRLMKDIVAESAPTYISIYPPNGRSKHTPKAQSPSSARFVHSSEDRGPANGEDVEDPEYDPRAFSLARFIPLLSERVYVISPYTRMHLVSWLIVLDSIPDLELVAWLPEFLDGLLKYLADGNVDVRLATENVLAEFLREIKYIAQVQEKQSEAERQKRETEAASQHRRHRDAEKDSMNDRDEAVADDDEEDGGESDTIDGHGHNSEQAEEETEARHNSVGEGSGAWVPGQGVFVDHAAIMDIMIQHLSYPDELVQSTAMEWILTFLEFAQNTVVAFTPRIIPAILPNLASPSRHIKLAAHETNSSLYRVIQSLPLQALQPIPPATSSTATNQNVPLNSGNVPVPNASAIIPHAGSPPASLPSVAPSPAGPALRRDTSASISEPLDSTKDSTPVSDPLEVSNSQAGPGTIRHSISSSSNNITTSSSASNVSALRIKPSPAAAGVTASEPVTPATAEFPSSLKTARIPDTQQSIQSNPPVSPTAETILDDDPFDVRETVNVLTLQFLSDHAETRIAALEWLLMLHLKAPNKILSRDSGTFPALLKTLSDPSEDVVKHDLQLLAQISASSEDFYFMSFMKNVLELFSTDRRLLESRGSLIIRQLCLHLNAERIFRTIAEILEKDDDLEFASMMVVKLNMILITSPELADFRRRLKHLDSKDGQMLFSSLYRSWCHNPVAVFALCLLAQAYEHAANLLQIFADLELTVSLLVQIDKLVMLIESPVFTNLRLQLLEPDKYPYLSKCLYGLLMILPQSSAFVSLRARLSIVHSSGYQPSPAKSVSTTSNVVAAARSKFTKDEIKWQELLSHFRSVQARHEKARRQLHSVEMGTLGSVHYSSPSQTFISAPSTAAVGSSSQIPKMATVRKKGAGPMTPGPSTSGLSGPRSSSGLSSLNPRRGGAMSSTGLSSGTNGTSERISGERERDRDRASDRDRALMSPGVSIGGAVASMNSSQGLGTLRSVSPTGGRRRLLGGLRKGQAGGAGAS